MQCLCLAIEILQYVLSSEFKSKEQTWQRELRTTLCD